MIDIEFIIEVGRRSPEARTLIERAETAAFCGEAPIGRPFSFLGDDRDHAADRISTIEATLRSAQHLDAFNVTGEHLSKIKRAVAAGGIAHLDAIDNELGMIRVGAAQEDRGLAAGTAGLHHVETRYCAERIRHRTKLLLLQLLPVDDSHSTRGFTRRRSNAG